MYGPPRLRQHIIEFIPGTGVVTDGATDATSVNGPWTWVVPDGIVGNPSVDVIAGGSGGGGGGGVTNNISQGGGGGGGSEAWHGYELLSVLPGESITITVGAGGTGGPAGTTGTGSVGTAGGVTSIVAPNASPDSAFRGVVSNGLGGANGGTASTSTYANGGNGPSMVNSTSAQGGTSGGNGHQATNTPALFQFSYGTWFARGGGGGGGGSNVGGTAGGNGGPSINLWENLLGMSNAPVGGTGGTTGTVSQAGGGAGGSTLGGMGGAGGNGGSPGGNGTGYGSGGGGGGGGAAGGNGAPGYARITYWSVS